MDVLYAICAMRYTVCACSVQGGMMRLRGLLEVWEEHKTRAGLLAVTDNLRGEIIQNDKWIIYALSNLLDAELKDFATHDFFKDIHNGEDIHMDNMDNMDNIEALQSEIEYMTLTTLLTT